MAAPATAGAAAMSRSARRRRRGPPPRSVLVAAALALAIWAVVSLSSSGPGPGSLRPGASPEPSGTSAARGEIGDASREALREILRREGEDGDGRSGGGEAAP